MASTKTKVRLPIPRSRYFGYSESIYEGRTQLLPHLTNDGIIIFDSIARFYCSFIQLRTFEQPMFVFGYSFLITSIIIELTK